MLDDSELLLPDGGWLTVPAGEVGSGTTTTVPAAAAAAAADDCSEEFSVVIGADRRLEVFVPRSSPVVTKGSVRMTKKIGRSLIILLLFNCLE